MLEKNKSILIKVSDLDRQDAKGNTLLHWAAETGDVDLVKELLKNKARVGLSNFAGDTAFSMAAAAGKVEVLRAFDEFGYNWHSDRSYNGKTPLYHAAQNGHLSAVMYLKEKGDFVDVPSAEGLPLHAAIKNDHFDVAAFLICEGEALDFKDHRSETPAKLLIGKVLDAKKTTPKQIMSAFRCLNLLMERGVSVRIDYREIDDVIDFYEGAEEKLNKEHVPMFAKNFKLIQKGHRTKQTEVGLDQVYKLLYEREY